MTHPNRLQELETHIKETYNIVENSEIINAMRVNKASKDFCQQRIQEAVGESFSSEKKMQIGKLSEISALLKTDLERVEQENHKIIQAYNEEIQKFNSTIGEHKATRRICKNKQQQ